MDLNLLIALNALLEENSVQAAANRLHLSASAVSRTLTRIRDTVGDEILVRTGRTMTPTPRALAMRDDVRSLVQQANALLSPAGTLDLANLRCTFTIHGHDALLSELALRLPSHTPEAPGVMLHFLTGSGSSTNAPDLAGGHVHLDLSFEVDSVAPATPGISRELVGHDRLVAVFRAGHVLEQFTLERFAAADHVIISRHGRPRDQLDDLLAQRGLRRRAVSVVSTSALALHAVAHSDVVTVMARRMGTRTYRDLGLRTHALDLDLPAPPVVLSWHNRYTDDPAHRWLRERVRAVVQHALSDEST